MVVCYIGTPATRHGQGEERPAVFCWLDNERPIVAVPWYVGVFSGCGAGFVCESGSPRMNLRTSERLSERSSVARLTGLSAAAATPGGSTACDGTGSTARVRDSEAVDS